MLIINIRGDIGFGLFIKTISNLFRKEAEVSLIYIRKISNMYLKDIQSRLNYLRGLQIKISQEIILKRVEFEGEFKLTNQLHNLYIKSDKIKENIQVLELQVRLIKDFDKH